MSKFKKRSIALLFLLAISVPGVQAAVVPVADEATWSSNVGASLLVDFEAFTGPVASEYSGLVFSPFNGGSPTAVDYYPYEGTNTMFTAQEVGWGGGGWAADFDTPTSGVAMWVGDLQFLGSTITFYDDAHEIIGFFDLLETGNGNGPTVYGFNAYISDSPNIARVEVTIDPSDAVWFDNVYFGVGGTASAPDGPAISTTWGRMKSSFR